MKDLTQTRGLLHLLRFIHSRRAKCCVASIIEPEFSSTSLVLQPLLSSIFSTSQILFSLPSSPLDTLDDFKSDCEPDWHPKHKLLFVQVRGVSVVILRLLIESQPHQSWAVNINVSCLLFTMPPQGAAPDRTADEKVQTWKRQQSVLLLLQTCKCFLSQDFTHAVYFRCETQCSRGEPADELDCPPKVVFLL